MEEIKKEDNEPKIREMTATSYWLKVIKSSLVRVVIFILVGAIAAGSISVIAGAVISSQNAKASVVIDFGFANITSGLDPLGDVFDKDVLKSAEIVNKAVDASGIDVEKSDLINAMTVVGVTPTDVLLQLEALKAQIDTNPEAQLEINKIKYFPTRFVVSINNYKSLNLKDDQAKLILEKVISTYRTWFEQKYEQTFNSFAVSLGENIDYSAYDYVERYDLFMSQYTIISNYIAEQMIKAPSYRSATSALNFADFWGKFNIIKNIELHSFDSLISGNLVTKDKTKTINYLQNQLQKLKIQKETVSAQVLSQAQLIENYKMPEVLIWDGQNSISTTALTQYYNDLVERQRILQMQEQNIQGEIRTTHFRLFLFDNTTPALPNSSNSDYTIPASNGKTEAQNMEDAETMTAHIKEAFARELALFGTFVEEYLKVRVYATAISAGAPPVVLKDTWPMTNNLLIAAIAAVVAGIVAFVISKNAYDKVYGKPKFIPAAD